MIAPLSLSRNRVVLNRPLLQGQGELSGKPISKNIIPTQRRSNTLSRQSFSILPTQQDNTGIAENVIRLLFQNISAPRSRPQPVQMTGNYPAGWSPFGLNPVNRPNINPVQTQRPNMNWDFLRRLLSIPY